MRAIIYQRMAANAVGTIYNRIRPLIRREPTPNAVLALSHESLRSAGLSDRKASTIHDLAEWFVVNPRVAKSLAKLSDEQGIVPDKCRFATYAPAFVGAVSPLAGHRVTVEYIDDIAMVGDQIWAMDLITIPTRQPARVAIDITMFHLLR